MRKKRTSAIGTCHVLHLGQFFWWIEGKRLKVRDKTYSSSDLGEQVLSMDEVVVEYNRWLVSCDSSYRLSIALVVPKRLKLTCFAGLECQLMERN